MWVLSSAELYNYLKTEFWILYNFTLTYFWINSLKYVFLSMCCDWIDDIQKCRIYPLDFDYNGQKQHLTFNVSFIYPTIQISTPKVSFKLKFVNMHM